MEKKIVLSGMRPTGKMHLGHLNGALSNWLKLQEEYDCFFFSADWHALTTEYADPGNVKTWREEMLLDWLAVGIDPEKATIFEQASQPLHAELFMLLGMVVPLPWLERVPTYKEQQQQLTEKDLNTYGFLGYPLLQTADIIMYKANFVPVGEDQLPHIEMSREVVRRFNNFYGEIFPEPEGKVTEVPRVPGIDGRKMSKSYNNTIDLTDNRDSVWGKLRPMVTDTNRKRLSDPGDPDICPVHDLHKIYSGPEQLGEVEEGCRTAGIGCIDCKKILFENMVRELEPLWERRIAYENKRELLTDILSSGNKAASKVAEATMAEVRKAIGL
jgi:tryptophanyl-tRNA synthetase